MYPNHKRTKTTNTDAHKLSKTVNIGLLSGYRNHEHRINLNTRPTMTYEDLCWNTALERRTTPGNEWLMTRATTIPVLRHPMPAKG